MHAIVHAADVQDRDGGALLLSTLFGMYPFLLKLFVDAGYQGPQFANAVAMRLPQLAVEIVKRSDQAKGFEVLPMRWVVERILAWLNRCLASIRLMYDGYAILHELSGLLGWTAPTASVCHNEVVGSQKEEPPVDKLIRIGVDTSKAVFTVHGVDATDRPILRIMNRSGFAGGSTA